MGYHLLAVDVLMLTGLPPDTTARACQSEVDQQLCTGIVLRDESEGRLSLQDVYASLAGRWARVGVLPAAGDLPGAKQQQWIHTRPRFHNLETGLGKQDLPPADGEAVAGQPEIGEVKAGSLQQTAKAVGTPERHHEGLAPTCRVPQVRDSRQQPPLLANDSCQFAELPLQVLHVL